VLQYCRSTWAHPAGQALLYCNSMCAHPGIGVKINFWMFMMKILCSWFILFTIDITGHAAKFLMKHIVLEIVFIIIFWRKGYLIWWVHWHNKKRTSWQCYMSKMIDFLDIIYHPMFPASILVRLAIMHGHMCKVSCMWCFKISILIPADGSCCVLFIYPALCWFCCLEIGTAFFNWVQLSRLFT
jgi:hypothetical protein